MGMTPAIDITAKQRRTVLTLLNRYLPDTTTWACGSRVKWTARPESDLDLVVFARPEQSARVAELREAFEESDLPFRVDLFVWDEISESFRKRIEVEQVVLVEREDRSTDGELLFGFLPDDWEYTTLGAACDRGGGDIQTGPFGSQLHASDYVAIGIPSIMPQNIGDNRINVEGIARIGPDDASRLNRYLVREGDIVYSRRGDVKRRALVRSSEEGWLCGTGCLRVRLGENGVDPRYASYFLGHPSTREWIVRHAHGATMPNLNTSILSACPFVIPPKVEQHAIAHILGTLDDKIELNRRMNEMLEAMAQSLFKSWFVDFDPVRAKMEGRDTGLPKPLADLFPNRLVDSECGEIPEGWKAGPLADIAIAPRRNVDPANLDDETPYIGLEHMPRRSIALAAWGRVGKVTSNKTAFNKGEILFGKLRPYFHKVGVAPINGVCSTDIVVIAAKAVEWSAFVLACVSSVEFVSYTNQSSTGTKMPRTNWTTMGDYRICLPAARVVGAFQHAMQPVLGQIAANVHESRTLAALRDALLPKLISGEIRFRDTARQTENVA